MNDIKNNILSISGGSDSTCMAIEMAERGENIHSLVFFDTGWEFPQILEHLEKLEQYLGMKIWHLTPRIPFDYWLAFRSVISRKGENKGKVYKIGYGWPEINQRWCTSQKIDTLDLFAHPIQNAVQCIGYNSEEIYRSNKKSQIGKRHPLQEYNINKRQTIAICKKHGFDFGGLYNIFRRVSCFCCPLQSKYELFQLYKHFPDLWRRLKEMDKSILPEYYNGFHWDGKRKWSIQDYENLFQKRMNRGFLREINKKGR